MTKNMAPAISINYRKQTIEISKDFQKKASVFNSEEYLELKAAKKDFPQYKVVAKAASKRTIESRITLKDIRYYVEKHSGADSKEMATLNDLCGVSVKNAEDLFAIEESASFAQIKKWFFNTYPEIGNKTVNRKNHINELVAASANKAAAKAVAADEAAVA